MAVTSIINLKGGVGKTTCCVALAEFLAGQAHRRVLVIDLDPQTNATLALIGERRWEQAEARGRTLRQMFLDEFVPAERRTFTIADCLQPHASNVEECQPNLWLLPSSLSLIGMEAMVEMVRAASGYTIEPFEVLARHLTPSIALAFDEILIDCPPSLNSITLNGLYVSDSYLIPTLPEPISTFGIPQILGRVANLRRAFGRLVPALGILINRFDLSSLKKRSHEESSRQLAALAMQEGYPAVFTTTIPERQRALLAMRYEIGSPTLTGKYHDGGNPPTDQIWSEAAQEYLDRCAALPTRPEHF